MRLFLIKNNGTVVEKQVYSGNDAQADSLVASYLASHPPYTSQEVNQTTFDAANVVTDQAPLRASAVSTFLNDPAPISKTDRAAALVTMDRVNIIHQWLMDLKAAIAAATSLANLQSRTAALPNLPQFQPSDIKTAVQNKLNSGDPD